METKLPERLRKEREKRGWSQSMVAEKLGLKSYSTYSNWEYGLRDPDSSRLVELSRLFEVSCDHLLGIDKSLDPDFIELAESVLTKEEYQILKILIEKVESQKPY